MKLKNSLSIAILTAVGASACCTIPLLVSIFGLSVLAGAGVFFEKFRFFFLSISFMFLLYAFYSVFLRAKIMMKKDPENCQCVSSSKTSKIILVSVSLITVAMLYFPQWSSLILVSNSSTIEVKDAKLVANLKLKGMTCQSCAVTIEEKFNTLSDVSSAKVTFENRKAIIYMKTSDKKKAYKVITESFKEIGYSIETFKWRKLH